MVKQFDWWDLEDSELLCKTSFLIKAERTRQSSLECRYLRVLRKQLQCIQLFYKGIKLRTNSEFDCRLHWRTSKDLPKLSHQLNHISRFDFNYVQTGKWFLPIKCRKRKKRLCCMSAEQVKLRVQLHIELAIKEWFLTEPAAVCKLQYFKFDCIKGEEIQNRVFLVFFPRSDHWRQSHTA
jgi:hypothetical protein